jgi:hypothetical protein
MPAASRRGRAYRGRIAVLDIPAAGVIAHDLERPQYVHVPDFAGKVMECFSAKCPLE